ncbi:alpha-amylase family glycosyl hydrolase [Lewinella sp. W8]|uniref:alpha-amylase family glycosyl hydrolase n=1 Tax=Lewinella sp. W8 TaxID=2528208 RepID=UPI001563D9DA|nr:alpha-amylase family glycosyl hydrolase [Lewinella sp. W8]
MRTLFLPLLLFATLSISAQDFMLQGWYWDYDKDGCNGYSGPNWASVLAGQVNSLDDAGFTYVWLPPMSRASFGACSNGYDPKDLYDLGEFGLGRTGFGTRGEVDAIIGALNARGMQAVADVVYNHRDGGSPEDNPAVKAYIETHFNGNGKQPYPSDRFRCRLPLGGAYGAGTYYIKISSKTQASSYVSRTYKFYPTIASSSLPYQGEVNESEPNGGGDCGQPFNLAQLNQDIVATLFDFSGCYTDEFALTITAADFNAGGDDLLIFLNNTNGYSDHRIYDIYYEPADGSPGFNIPLSDLVYQTYTDFTALPSGQGGMNFENFRPNTSNAATTFLSGDWDSKIFFYDIVQAEASTATTYNDWTNWLLTDVGVGGLRMDAVKHFPPSFVGQLLDDLAGRGQTPDMVVGELFDGNPNLLKAWVDDVTLATTSSSAVVRVFDFTLRNALKEASDNGGYDLRNVFNASLRDAVGLPGFNAVTFVNNHDFRGPGEPIQQDPMLGYAYILTNNQIGVPTVFYPDFFGKPIPNAPTVNLSAEISQLMAIHRAHIFGSPTIEYLNRFGTNRSADYQSGQDSRSLIYQMSGGAGAQQVVVAINYAYETLKVNQELAPANGVGGGSTFLELTGNAFNTTATLGNDRKLLIDVPARSYAVYILSEALPLTLNAFTALPLDKGVVQLDWSTSLEEDLAEFVLETSEDGFNFRLLHQAIPNNRPATYRHLDDRPWINSVRYYRLRTRELDGSEHLSEVRTVWGDPSGQLAAFPNPTDHLLRVRGTGATRGWQLMAADGRSFAAPVRAANDNEIIVDLGEVPAGVYVLRRGEQVVRVVRSPR